MERKVMGNNSRPQKEQALNCPRCQSTNTKFCYYNNYSLTQPRYFCKTCRRYWTEGGTLRNVPVGGGSRKNKLIRSSSCSSSSTTNKINIIPAAADHHHQQQQHQEFSSHQNPYNYYKILHDSSAGQDLNLGFPITTTSITPSFAALEILRSTGGGGADLNNSFIIPPPQLTATNAHATTPAAGGAGFTFQDLKTTSTTTTVSSYMNRYGGGAAGGGDNEMMINQENSGRLMFPLFGGMKQVSGGGGTTTTAEADADQNSNYGYNWDGMMLGTRSSGASW